MTISIRRTSRAADSPGGYFDRVSLDPYYMHRHRTGRSTSTWVPADPYYSSDGGQSSPPRQTSRAADSPGIPARAQLRAADRFANRIFHRSIRSVGLEPNADRFGSHPFRWTHVSAVMTPAYATQFDSNHIRSASTSTRTAPVDDQLPPRRSPQRRFIVLPVLRQFFHNFLLSHRHHVQIAISRCFLSASLRILCSVHSDFR